MYDQILKALFEANSCKTDKEEIAYLNGLKPSAQQLWDAYQNQAVKVSYADSNIRAAYLLRYFPPYTQLIQQVLLGVDRNALKTLNQTSIKACFFGAGPAPELYGFLRFLKRSHPRAKSVDAHLYDVSRDDWQFALEINRRTLIPQFWNSLRTLTVKFDIAKPRAIQLGGQVRGTLQLSDIVVFQNCLNEVPPSSRGVLRANLRQLVGAMKMGAILVVIERKGYAAVDTVLADIRGDVEASSTAVLLGKPNEARYFNCVSTYSTMPKILTDNLFLRKSSRTPPPPEESGLILGRDIKYRALIVAKKDKGSHGDSPQRAEDLPF
ncbi:MAG: hypothetical protein HY261_03290 [Chloroflexi bacterium]|nr:hypothetical protein [Chloroflexota bacterium]